MACDAAFLSKKMAVVYSRTSIHNAPDESVAADRQSPSSVTRKSVSLFEKIMIKAKLSSKLIRSIRAGLLSGIY